MSAPWISVSVTLGLFVISHIVVTVWWASRVSTLLDRVQTDLRDIVAELKAARHVYVTKDDLALRVSQSDQEHAELRRRVSLLEER